MPNFSKSENNLKTRLDQWLFFIKHLEDFQSIPIIFKDETIFSQAFEKAELAKYDSAEWESYESSLKEYRDIKGYIDTAFDEGKTERTNEIAKALKNNNVSIDIIIKTTGLSKIEIDKCNMI